MTPKRPKYRIVELKGNPQIMKITKKIIQHVELGDRPLYGGGGPVVAIGVVTVAAKCVMLTKELL